MALKLSAEIVRNIAEEIDALPDEATAYLNRNTGEVYVMLDELDLEDPEIADGLPEWQKADLAKQKAVLSDDAWIFLPSSFDVHEWELMKEFAEQNANPEVREDLLGTIHGSGAFRRFKRALDQYGQRDEWFAFKAACVEDLVKEWLRSKDIEFEDET